MTTQDRQLRTIARCDAANAALAAAKAQTQHTPGPWKCQHAFSDLWRYTLDTQPATSAEAEANARLIAAAPDLLAACKDALLIANTVRQAEKAREWGEEMSTDAYDDEYTKLTLKAESFDKAIRAAIAKASGQTKDE